MSAPSLAVIAAAQAAQAEYDILASIQIAQWALESGWGASVTGRFNYFGVKAGPIQPGTVCPTHEFVNGRRILTSARFRDFSSLDEAFGFHALLLATGEAYREAWPHRHDYAAYARAMGPRYATEPGYAENLIKLIQGDSLLRYDLAASAKANDADPIDQFKSAIGET